MTRRKPTPLPPIVIDMSRPCKNGQPFVAADGSCLRCGADQGVSGYACNRRNLRGVDAALSNMRVVV